MLHGHGQGLDMHINIFELASTLQVVKRIARRGGGRFSVLVDSFVALRALAKGRIASKALAPLLRKIMALSVAFDCYGVGLFCPTRLNPSDDPTRSVPLRTPCSDKPAFQTLPISELYGLSKLPKSKRWAANWVALVICLSCRGFLSIPGTSPDEWRMRSSQLPVGFHEFHEFSDFGLSWGGPGQWFSPLLLDFLPWLSCS